MKHTERDWLRAVPWEMVLSWNQTFCETQQTNHELRGHLCEKARQLWEKSAVRPMSLPDAVEVCRQCYEIGPFVFNNGNTFAAAAKKLMEDWLEILPSLESQIARTTVGHYVAGQIEKNEMVDVLSQFESKWKINPDLSGLPQTLAQPSRTAGQLPRSTPFAAS